VAGRHLHLHRKRRVQQQAPPMRPPRLPRGIFSWRPLSVVSLVVAGVAVTRVADASSVTLEWSAPEACPSSAAVSTAIDRSLGTNRSTAPVHARVLVSQEASTFHAEIDLGGPGALETRRIDAESCGALADAVALVLALAADSDAAPPREAPPPPRLASASTLPQDWFVGASFLLDSAILPSPAAGGDLAIGYGPSRTAVEIDGAFLAPQSATLADRASQGARMWLAQAGARVCYAAIAAQVDVGPCAGGAVAWIVAHGFGGPPDRPSDATATLAVGTLGARARLRVAQRLVFRLAGEAVVPTSRPTFAIDGGGDVFHVPAASFRASLGAEVSF
jgi:hypothetical protein